MRICINLKERLFGLMFKKEIKEDYLFPNCKSIHTFFMKINIDVVALNKNGKIIKIYRNISPNKIIFAPRGTHSIIETISNSKYQEGMNINEFKKLEI